uniref:RING-type domain-containing protein n=1 Tax=Periophthalmus magnuspinnatus TaxID=409849 RepID=A0A3B3Z6E3_9GOBI
MSDSRDRQNDGRPPQQNVKPKLPNDTECAICFCAYDNIFKTPKLLSCGHTFCLECLARINVTSMELKSLPCPVCREITQIPHGQDLPRLGTNQDILQKLPPQMQRILSIRFKRSQGKLMLKTQHQAHQEGAPTSPTNVKSLSTKKPSSPDAPARTVVNVGRPPNRVHGRLRRLFRSDRCYYTVVVTIITITVILMLIGILAFVIIPNVTMHRLPNKKDQNQRRTTKGAEWNHRRTRGEPEKEQDQNQRRTKEGAERDQRRSRTRGEPLKEQRGTREGPEENQRKSRTRGEPKKEQRGTREGAEKNQRRTRTR